MSNKKDKLVEDVIFVFDECKRIRSELRAGNKSAFADGPFYVLPHPSGRGGMYCGETAYARVSELANEAARRAGIAQRVSLINIRKPIEKLLVERFITVGRPITTQQIERIFSKSAKVASENCSTKTHYIPCHLMWADEPDQFNLGPVIFLNRKKFRRILFSKISNYRSTLEPDKKHWGLKLLANALRYYRSFKWVAEVTIVGCDPESSARHADNAVSAALDCLHVFFGAGVTDRMRVGGPRIVRDERAHLCANQEGGLEPALSSSAIGQVEFSKGWSKALDEENFKTSFNLAGVAIEAVVNPDFDRPISQRFLDAARWFGEATRESSQAARVIKFTTALERAVMTDEKDDIAKCLSERVAALCCCYQGTKGFGEYQKEAQALYRIRSKLVHGSMSPSSPDLVKGVLLGGELGRKTILSVLYNFDEGILRRTAASTKHLARWFNHIVSTARTTSWPMIEPMDPKGN
jgi:hypothetical protein